MAIKKSAEAHTALKLNIEQAAELYKQLNSQKKEIEKKEKVAKDTLLDYAKKHNELFEDNVLHFSNGVNVENRMRTKYVYNEITMDWLNKFVANGHGDIVDISLKNVVDKDIPELSEIDFDIEYTDVFAVTVK